MFDQENILTSPLEIARDPNASEPLRLVLEDPHQARLTKLRLATFLCGLFVVAAGIIVWVWGYFGGERHNPGFWHVSLVSVLFWLSITQGMVALSAILRITHASWRYPLNRLLDMMSLFGLWGFALLPFLVIVRAEIYSLGVSQYRDNVWRIAGSSLFDNLAVGTMYIAGLALLYLTSLPDFAMLRDRAPDGSKEQRFYQRLTQPPVFVVTFKPIKGEWVNVLWVGAEDQWRVLRRAEGILVVGVIASFVGSQTVLGWDFQLAAARNWDSSIFAPLYTLGSLLGAAAMTVLVMTVANSVLRGRGFFGVAQYESLGKLMIALGLVWFYFRFCDYLTAWYGHIPEEWQIQNNRTIAFPVLASIMTLGCFVIPVFANMIEPIRKSVRGLCAISVCVLLGLLVNRYLDTVPTFALKYTHNALLPTIPGVLVFTGVAAMFVLTYLLGARYFPIISWWGTSKDRTRTGERTLGNTTVTVMVEDPPLWET